VRGSARCHDRLLFFIPFPHEKLGSQKKGRWSKVVHRGSPPQSCGRQPLSLTDQRSPSHNASASCDRCCLKPIRKPNERMSKPLYTADRPCCRAGRACTRAEAGSVAANSCIRGNTYCCSRNAEFPELGEFAIVPRIPLLRERRIAAIRAPSMRLALSAFSMQACYALKRVANVNYKLIKARKDPPI
jgi:hypothetical protein